jgi:hypothetical protein
MRDATAKQTFGFRVLRAACIAYEQGDEVTIRQLGFSLDEAKALSQTQLGYLYRISVSAHSFLHVKFGNNISWVPCNPGVSGLSTMDDVLASFWEFCVAAADTGCLKPLHNLGLTDTDIRFILSMPSGAAGRLRLSGASLEFTIDHVRLGRLLKHIDGENSESWAITELIRLGATHAMLKALFPVPPRSMQMQRKLLGVGKGASGRPPVLSDEIKYQIELMWVQCAHFPKASRFIEIARKTEAPLASIWAFVSSGEFVGGLSKESVETTSGNYYQAKREVLSTKKHEWGVSDVERNHVRYSVNNKCLENGQCEQLAYG